MTLAQHKGPTRHHLSVGLSAHTALVVAHRFSTENDRNQLICAGHEGTQTISWMYLVYGDLDYNIQHASLNSGQVGST